MLLTEKYLKDIDACKEAIDFCKGGNLFVRPR